MLTARQGIFDQVVDVVEGDLVDGLLDFEESQRLAFEKDHDGGFDGDNRNVLSDGGS